MERSLMVILVVVSTANVCAALRPPETLSNVGKFQTIAYANGSSSAILQSIDGEYQWKFINYNSSSGADRRLLVIINTQFNTTVVWIANRNSPVSPNATLFIEIKNRTEDARIVLADLTADAASKQHQRIVWSTPAGVHSVQMHISGNLIMRDSVGNLKWQSFDEPTDVMVPGQFLTAGHNITAGIAWNDVTTGHYSLRVDAESFRIYASFDAQQNMVPYVIIRYAKYRESPGGSNCNHTTVIYKSNASGILLQQMVESANGTLASFITPECQLEDKVTHEIPFLFSIHGDGFRYLRIMPTGDVNTFVLDSSGLHLDSQILLTYAGTYCKLPSYCGVNSICSLSSAISTSHSTCTCPSLFSKIDDSDATKGCRLDTPLNCSIPTQHEFIPIAGVDYFANPWFAPHNVSSAAECTALCLPNCSCTAVFYDNATGHCYLYDTVQTIQAGVNPSMTAYLRVAKLPGSPSVSFGTRSISKIAIVGVSIGGAVVLLIGVWAGRKFTKADNHEESDEEEAFLESMPGLPPRYSYKELQKATEGFSNNLGKGGSGAVFVGYIHPRPAKIQRSHNNVLSSSANKTEELLKVAVKELHLTGESSTLAAANKKQFRAEVATLGRLSHINLVMLKGFCAQGSHRLLIYEFLENGSLDRWIFTKLPNEVLPWEKRYRIAVDTARGLAFLHEGSRDQVLHLDVKPQNILLDGDFRAKLADFGLAKLMDRSKSSLQTLTALRGTPGYMAPEWLLNLPITDKSDVYSYGMVLLELVGGRKNINLELDSDIDEWYFPTWAVKQAQNGNLLDIIDKRLMSGKDEIDKECETNMSRLARVAFWCIQESPPSRPSMSTVLLMLEKHLETPPPPLDLIYVVTRQSHPPPQVQNYDVNSSPGGIIEVSSALIPR